MELDFHAYPAGARKLTYNPHAVRMDLQKIPQLTYRADTDDFMVQSENMGYCFIVAAEPRGLRVRIEYGHPVIWGSMCIGALHGILKHLAWPRVIVRLVDGNSVITACTEDTLQALLVRWEEGNLDVLPTLLRDKTRGERLRFIVPREQLHAATSWNAQVRFWEDRDRVEVPLARWVSSCETGITQRLLPGRDARLLPRIAFWLVPCDLDAALGIDFGTGPDDVRIVPNHVVAALCEVEQTTECDEHQVDVLRLPASAWPELARLASEYPAYDGAWQELSLRSLVDHETVEEAHARLVTEPVRKTAPRTP